MPESLQASGKMGFRVWEFRGLGFRSKKGFGIAGIIVIGGLLGES